MAHASETKQRVCNLRKKGLSIPAIAKEMHLSKSTISLWVRDVVLPDHLLEQLRKKSMDGRTKGRLMRLARLDALQGQRIVQARELANRLISKMDEDTAKLMAAVLFWCEGSKRGSLKSGVIFTNSDPELIRFFIQMLEKGFSIDRKKFHLLLHLHDYHNDEKQKRYWAGVTGLPLAQFNRSYRKPHTKVRIRNGYQGCLSLRYGDAGLAKFLAALYHASVQGIIGE